MREFHVQFVGGSTFEKSRFLELAEDRGLEGLRALYENYPATYPTRLNENIPEIKDSTEKTLVYYDTRDLRQEQVDAAALDQAVFCDDPTIGHYVLSRTEKSEGSNRREDERDDIEEEEDAYDDFATSICVVRGKRRH